MRLIVTGHRQEKIQTYDWLWIRCAIDGEISRLQKCSGVSIAYSGMASGIDLQFCECCDFFKIPWIACIPFEGQEDTMDEHSKNWRTTLLKNAKQIKQVKNSWMVENCDHAIVVFDGNKGGTANVFQQLIEKKKNFSWINPVAQVVWPCFVNA